MSRKKQVLVGKAAEETGAEASDLNHLPVESLEKLDDLTPDSPVEIESPVLEDPKKESIFLGFHPITGEKVYS